MFLCNTLSVWEDLDEVAVVLVEVAEERVDKIRKNGDPNPKKKDATDKKYIFTLIESTVDVRVSAYETTFKKLYVLEVAGK